jgi:hypothetical protein
MDLTTKEDNTAVIIKDQFQEDITSEQKKHLS